jgi:hypothetical protein
MAQWRTYLNILRIIGLGTIGCALMVTSVAAQELGPVETGLAAPVSDGPEMPEISPVEPEPITVRQLHPVNAGTFKAMKTEARNNPAAQAAAQLQRSSGPAPNASDIVTSFVGLDRPGAVNNGFVFFPPDTIVGKSVTRVLEATNSALRLFTNAGAPLATSNLNAFFSVVPAGSSGLLFDPKVYFDRNAANRRFYVTALERRTGPNVSRIHLAISRSPEPGSLAAANWCRYAIDGRRNIGTADESFADYPGLGVGADALVISHNNFRFSNDTFTFAIVRAFRKLVAANNAAGCPAIPFFTFQPSAAIGNGSFTTLQPVQHYTSPSSFAGTTNPAYLVNSIFGSSNIYRVWRVRNVAGAASLQGPTDVAGGFVYGVQPDAPQGGGPLLDTGDNRVTQAAGVGNALRAVHGTLCNVGGGTNESCVRHVRITVGQSVFGALTAGISAPPEQGTFGFPNEFYFWPGVAVNGEEQIILPFHFANSTLTGGRLSSWWTMKALGSPPEPILPITSGTCSQTISNRTGDFIGAQTDPTDFHSFFLAGERATTIGGTCQWQTRIIGVSTGFGIINLGPQQAAPTGEPEAIEAPAPGVPVDESTYRALKGQAEESKAD